MKPLLSLLALLLCATFARADIAEVKRVMDEPVVFRYITEKGEHERAKIAPITNGKSVQDIERVRGIEGTTRALLQWLSTSQGRSSADLKLLHKLAVQNAATLREKLLPTLKDAGLIAAASDLEEALASVEKSGTMERAAQDRFARLARVGG